MRKKAGPKKSESRFRYTARTKDLPASQGMVQLVRTELKADVRELRAEMNARFNQVDARFNQMDARFERMESQIARVGMLVEEQNARNSTVMEGLTGLWQRQESLETMLVANVERAVSSAFARAKFQA